MEAIDLNNFARSVHSQWGEDGILEEIYLRLAIEKGYFVEFGAWDGKHFSNAYNLYLKGWRGLYIEGDPKRSIGLQREFGSDPRVKIVQSYVGVDGPTSLDAIMAKIGASDSPDLLSIDIDSDDLAVFMAIKRVKAKCVVIEYNQTIPFDTEYINKPGKPYGNGALSIKRYAESVGYKLVAITGTNLIFVERRLAGPFSELQLERYPNDTPRLAFGYDGTLLVLNCPQHDEDHEVVKNPWHGYWIPQPMPRFLREWDKPGLMSRMERPYSLVLLLLTRPIIFLKEMPMFVREISQKFVGRR